MASFDRDLLIQSLRYDFPSFVQRAHQIVSPGRQYLHNCHIDLIADRLERCRRGELTRVIITVPPRYLKSTCASIAFPAFLLGHDPSARIVCASYSSELAVKLALSCRAVMESAFYREVFPKTRLDPRKNTETEMTTKRQGFRLATSVGGSLTGRGGDYIILDDPHNAAEAMSTPRREATIEWYRTVVCSRLDDKARGRIIIVTQRIHVDDLVGSLLESGEDWEHLNLPAIAEQDECFDLGDGRVFERQAGEALHPEREPLEVLEGNKRAMRSMKFAAQYQQNPVPPEGNMIRWDWFEFYDEVPEQKEGDLIVQSWDTASKAGERNSYSVCTTWLRRKDKHYLLDVKRRRVLYPELKRLVVEMAHRFQAGAVLIEDKGSGVQLIQDLRDQNKLRPVAITPVQDKQTRMYTQSAIIESGCVLLPKAAPWLDAFRNEILQFPDGKFDDQVDSLSQCLSWRSPKKVKVSDFRFFGSSAVSRWDSPWNLFDY